MTHFLKQWGELLWRWALKLEAGDPWGRDWRKELSKTHGGFGTGGDKRVCGSPCPAQGAGSGQQVQPGSSRRRKTLRRTAPRTIWVSFSIFYTERNWGSGMQKACFTMWTGTKSDVMVKKSGRHCPTQVPKVKVIKDTPRWWQVLLTWCVENGTLLVWSFSPKPIT